MKTKEYQVGTMAFSQVEKGQFSQWLVVRTKTGWILKSTEHYFSIKHNEDCLFWVLEREI